MLTLRLSRAGTKKRPVYHLVAADKRARRDGRFVENLGYFIPARNVLVLKHDRINYWLSVGAATTEVARRLIRRAQNEGNLEPQAKPKYVAPPVEAVEVKVPPKEGAKKDAAKADKKADAGPGDAPPPPEKSESGDASADGQKD